jgi:hypothetical protein
MSSGVAESGSNPYRAEGSQEQSLSCEALFQGRARIEDSVTPELLNFFLK